MARKPKDVWYWPLGALNYVDEIRESYPTEAELLGVITILWNRQDIALERLFVVLLGAKQQRYASAIWDRLPTHQARRDLLALARDTAELDDRQKDILDWIIRRTKTLADRRNELIHAEYVVEIGSDVLHTRVKAPRSTKPPKHQRAMESDLKKIAQDISELVQATEAAWIPLGGQPIDLQLTEDGEAIAF